MYWVVIFFIEDNDLVVSPILPNGTDVDVFSDSMSLGMTVHSAALYQADIADSDSDLVLVEKSLADCVNRSNGLCCPGSWDSLRVSDNSGGRRPVAVGSIYDESSWCLATVLGTLGHQLN